MPRRSRTFSPSLPSIDERGLGLRVAAGERGSGIPTTAPPSARLPLLVAASSDRPGAEVDLDDWEALPSFARSSSSLAALCRRLRPWEYHGKRYQTQCQTHRVNSSGLQEGGPMDLASSQVTAARTPSIARELRDAHWCAWIRKGSGRSELQPGRRADCLRRSIAKASPFRRVDCATGRPGCGGNSRVLRSRRRCASRRWRWSGGHRRSRRPESVEGRPARAQ